MRRISAGKSSFRVKKSPDIRILLICISMVAFLSCSNDSTIEKRRILMDTTFRIKIRTQEKSIAEPFMDSLFSEIAKLDKKIDFYDKDSQLYKINNSNSDTIKVDGHIKSLLDSAFYWRDATDDDFDPGIGALSLLWGIPDKGEFVPPDELVKRTLVGVALGRSSHLEGNKLINTSIIDLGGIAKGYALGIIYQRLQLYLEKGKIDEFLIDAGRSVQGRRPDGSFKIGIAHPRKADSLLAIFELPDRYSCSTCGDYERYFIKNGVRYHHILDPKTGYPARKSIAATVIGKSAAGSDALSTAAFVKGPERRYRIYPKASRFRCDDSLYRK